MDLYYGNIIPLYGSFQQLGVPDFGVFISPLFSETPYYPSGSKYTNSSYFGLKYLNSIYFGIFGVLGDAYHVY